MNLELAAVIVLAFLAVVLVLKMVKAVAKAAILIALVAIVVLVAVAVYSPGTITSLTTREKDLINKSNETMQKVMETGNAVKEVVKNVYNTQA